MPETSPLRVGDRVTVEEHDGVFIVLSVDYGAQSASLLPSGGGKLLDGIAVDAMTTLPKPSPNAATAG